MSSSAFDDFDPEADSSDLRSKYSDLLQNVKTNRHEFLQASSNALGQVIDQSSTLYSAVKNPQMATVDASLLTLSADISTQRLNCMSKVGSALGLNEWLSKLRISGFQVGNASEEMLGRIACSTALHAPSISTLIGIVNLPSSQEEPQSTNERRQVTKRTLPLESGQSSSQSLDEQSGQQIQSQEQRMMESETTVMIVKVHEILRQVGPISLYKFIVNPNSFGQSVENLFWTSFLVREEKARIFQRSENGQKEWFIEEIVDEGLNDASKSSDLGEKRQFVCEFDMRKWQQYIEKYSITRSVIPHRR